MRQRILIAVITAGIATATFANATSHESIEEITVTASRTGHRVAEAPATVTVIDSGDIERKGATDLLEAVRATPGVTLLGRQVGGRKTFSIRGTGSQHTLVLVDGRRIASTDDVIGHSDFQIGWIPMSQVERVEVVRGPMSALYGSEAMGGVVNLITKRAGQRWSAQGTTRGDLNGDAGGESRQFALSAGGPIADWLQINLSAESFEEDDVPLREDMLLSELEGRRREGGTVDLTFTPFADHEFFASFVESREDRWRDNRESSGQRRYFRDRYDIARSQQSVGYRGAFGDIHPEIRYTRTDFDVTNTRDQGVAPTRPQALNDEVVDGHVALSIGRRHLVTVGGEFRDETLHNAGLANGRDDATHEAAYLQDEFALSDTLTLTVGGRSDWHKYFGNELSPRAYLTWKVTPSLIVKGGYGEAFRAPTLKQISPNYVGAEGPHTFYGNEAVRPETSRTYDLGVVWSGPAHEVSATLFRNDIDDLIDLRLLNVQGIRRFYLYDNITTARIDGIELSASRELGHGIAIQANYTYLNPTNRETNEKLNGRPAHSVNASADWQSGPIQLSLTGEYIGRQYLESTVGPARTPSYLLGHVSCAYTFNDHFRLRIGVNNLADIRLRDESELFGYVEPGRTVYAALNASF